MLGRFLVFDASLGFCFSTRFLGRDLPLELVSLYRHQQRRRLTHQVHLFIVAERKRAIQAKIQQTLTTASDNVLAIPYSYLSITVAMVTRRKHMVLPVPLGGGGGMAVRDGEICPIAGACSQPAFAVIIAV